MVIAKCLPFFFFAGFGVYAFCVALFPSWRGPGWKRWALYTGYNDMKPRSWSRSLSLIKLAQAVSRVELSDRRAKQLYLAISCVSLIIAFLGIRHFAGVPEAFPDLFER